MPHTLQYLCLITLLGFLTGCGQLDLLPGGDDGDNNGNGSGASNLGLCSSADTGPDSDGDGLSDACEDMRGTDPNNPDSDGNGITDNNELPPGMPLEQAQAEGWWPGFMQQLMNNHQTGNLLTSSFFQKQAPPGSEVTVTSQTLEFFIDGVGDGNQDNYNFCHNNPYNVSGNHYIYFYIAGSVKVCDDCALDTSYMKMCGVLDNPSTQLDAEYTQEFQWHIAQTKNGRFDPTMIPRGGDQQQSIAITPLSAYSDAPNTIKKVKVKFDSKFKITGSALNNVTGETTPIQTETISVFRTFKRTGPYTSDDGLNGQYVRDELDSLF
jgi:hypothetical protein